MNSTPKQVHKSIQVEVRGLDVWGNSDDGYEVNDVYGVQTTLEVPHDVTNAGLIKALIDADVLYAGEYSFDDFSDESIFGHVTDPKTGRPIVQVRAKGRAE